MHILDQFITNAFHLKPLKTEQEKLFQPSHMMKPKQMSSRIHIAHIYT